MKNYRFLLLPLLLLACQVSVGAEQAGNVCTGSTTVLYGRVFNSSESYPELTMNGVASNFTADGLEITGKDNVVMLDKYYSLGQRLVRYRVTFAADAKAVFQGSAGLYKAYVDMPGKKISVNSNPEAWKTVDFLDPGHEYMVEIKLIYNRTVFSVTDLFTGECQDIDLTHDGPGGHGRGTVNRGVTHGYQWDHYCFGLVEGSSMTVRQMIVQTPFCGLTLLLYGDSITQPEGYFPAADFPQAWTQLIMNGVKGYALASGRGGCTINEVLDRIRNELPYLKAKYVMVTIGTNGGNTEENLSQLVEYIQSQGSIPILNNIPSNERGSHIEVNAMIEKIRQKYGIKGCKFDIATSVNQEGKEVDKSTMWYEDFEGTWGNIYHHPNVKGSRLMYLRTLLDTPEIYQ